MLGPAPAQDVLVLDFGRLDTEAFNLALDPSLPRAEADRLEARREWWRDPSHVRSASDEAHPHAVRTILLN